MVRVIQAILIHRKHNTDEQADMFLQRNGFKNDDVTLTRSYYVCRQLDASQLKDDGYSLHLELYNWFRKVYAVIAIKP